MASNACLDPVGVALTERLVPGAVSDVELACRVALDVPGQLLQLDPEHAFPGWRTGVVDGKRLPDDDGPFGGEQSPFRLVDCARDAVEPGGEMDDGGLVEPVVAVPPRWLRQREMDLHLGAAE